MRLLNINHNDIEILIEKLSQSITQSFIKNKDFFLKNYKRILIISGGFKEIIVPIVDQFGIIETNVFANQFVYNLFGDVIGIDKNNVMSKNKGKVKTTITNEENGMKKITKEQNGVSMSYYE